MKNLFGKKGFLGVVSIVLTLCLCVGMLVAIPTTVAAEGDIQVWGGPKSDVTEDYASIQQDADGNYLITTGEQLYAAIKKGGEGRKYKLANDIYLNDISNFDNWTSASPTNKWDLGATGSANNYSGVVNFSGSLNGDNHTIYGFYSSMNFYAALIPGVNMEADDYDDTVVIENINMQKSWIAGVGGGAFIVGVASWVDDDQLIVQNCTVSNSMVNHWKRAGSAVGIILGDTNKNTTIRNCAAYNIKFNAAIASADGYTIGSILGGVQPSKTDASFDAWVAQRVKVQNSYAVDVSITYTDKGKTAVWPIGITLDGSNKYGNTVTVNNVYTDSTTQPTVNGKGLNYSADGQTQITTVPVTTITADGIKGEAAKTAMPALEWGFTWSTVENGYPVPVPAYEIWDGTTATIATAGFGAGQDGSATAPYEVTNGKQLYAAVTSNAGYHFVLKKDIYLNKDYANYDKWNHTGSAGTDSNGTVLNTWVVGASNTFSGTIDGAGYTVYGLFGATTAGDGGLIPYIGGAATIKNLNVENSLVRCGTRAGILVGRIQSVATNENGTYYPPVAIENVTIDGARLEGLNTAGWAGAMVGYLNAGATTINNCAVTNVSFGSGSAWNTTNYSEYASFGAFVGANVAGTTYETDTNAGAATYSKGNAANLIVKNSYSFNVTNDIATTPYNIYPVGIQLFYDSSNSNPYQHKVSAIISNVYTDAELKSFSINNETPVQIQIGDTNDTSKVVEDYSTVVKTIDSDNMKGLLDSGAWYTGKLSTVSADNLPKLRSNITRFTYADINGDGIDAAYTAADILPVREYLLGTVEYAYIDGDANASGAIDIRDLVNVYNILK